MFLFGAGVEGKGNYNLVSGYEYIRRSLLGAGHDKKISNALKRYFNRQYFGNYTYSFHKCNSVLLLQNLIVNKCFYDYDFFIKHRDKIQSILYDRDFKQLSEDCNLKSIIEQKRIKHVSNDIEKNKLIDCFLEIVMNDEFSYEKIEDQMIKEIFVGDEMGNATVDMNGAVGGMLDGYFHTIISPAKYGKYNFSKVFNYYWFSYFTLMEGILNYYSDDEILSKYLDNDKPNYFKIISNISTFTKLLYDTKEKDNKSTYYNIIKKQFENFKGYEISAIATTNYFKFAESIGKETIYLNGKLCDFEKPELLEVDNAACTEFNNESLFFPFIFGQSLIKPIVDKTQINTFNEFVKKLGESDILVVFGFNINEDDNHINSFLHDYVKNKPIIVVGTKSEKNGVVDICKKLHFENNDNINYCSVTYGNNANVVDKIIEKITSVFN